MLVYVPLDMENPRWRPPSAAGVALLAKVKIRLHREEMS